MREGCRRLQLERHIVSRDLQRGGLIRSVDLQPTAKLPLDNPLSWLLDPDKSGHWHLGLRRYSCSRPFARPTALHRFYFRRQRRSDTGLTVAITQAANVKFADGDKPLQTIIAPQKSGRFEADFEFAEW